MGVETRMAPSLRRRGGGRSGIASFVQQRRPFFGITVFFSGACMAGAATFELSLGGLIDTSRRSTMCRTHFGDAIGECVAEGLDGSWSGKRSQAAYSMDGEEEDG